MHRQHGEGICGCPKVRVMAWVGPAVTGWQKPVFLVAARSPDTVRRLRQVAGRFGLRPGAVIPIAGAMVHCDGAGTAVLVCGPERVGPVPVSGQWVELARVHGEVVLLVGMVPVPEGVQVDAYLDQHGQEVVTGLVPVAGAPPHQRCLAGVTVPEPVPGSWALPGFDGRVEC